VEQRREQLTVSNRNDNLDNNNGFRMARSSGTVVDATLDYRTGSAPDLRLTFMSERNKTKQFPARPGRPRGFRFEGPGGVYFIALLRGVFLRGIALIQFLSTSLLAIQAGGELDLPTDFPSQRIDDLSSRSAYAFAGALEISAGASNYFGSGVALSRNWVLSAGHNVDFNDDGSPDSGLTIDYHLPGFGSYTATSYLTNPSFTGFGNPSVHNDLSLLYFSSPLPDLAFPSLGLSMATGDQLDLVGFGRSGFGSYGHTTNAGLTDRRTGANVVDSFEAASSGSGLLFRYDFDAPDTSGTVGGSLGNEIETIIGPGDSGGPALTPFSDTYALVGINTFTEGYSGLFGDMGGGVALNDQWDWIFETTGLFAVPEPSQTVLILGGIAALVAFRKRKR
jgi:hypothetical protein